MNPFFRPGGTALTAAADTNSIVIVVVVIAIILAVIVINAIRGGGGIQSSAGTATRFNLRKMAKKYGLAPDQTRILKAAIRKQKLGNPSSLFTNGHYLNGCLRKLMKEVDASSFGDRQKDLLKSRLFDIKQQISAQRPDENRKLSTRGIPVNQPAVIQSRTFPPFQSEILGKTSTWVVMELPRDSHGEFVQYRPGETVKVKYIKEGGQVFAFMTTVHDMREVEGEMRLLLDHCDTVRRIQLRKSPRKDFRRAVFVYKVEVITEGKGRKEQHHASVDRNKRHSGTMVDISAGGCAVQVRTAFPKGSIVMVSFDIKEGETVNVFARVRATQKERGSILMRMAFTKVSVRTMNDIRSVVYGFEEEDNQAPRNKYFGHG